MKVQLGFASCAIVVAGAAAMAFGLSGTAQALTGATFRYSAPKTGAVTVDAAAMIPSAESLSYLVSSIGGLKNTGGGPECFEAGVNFPDHAKISIVTMWYSSSANGSPSFSLVRRTLSNGSTVAVAQKAGSLADTSTAYKAGSASANPTLARVSNVAYSYNFLLCMPQTDHFYGARIKYTYTTAGD